VQASIAMLGSVVTHPTVFIAMWKYLFKNGWAFPFYSIVFVNAIPFIVAVCYFLYKLSHHNKLNEPMLYLHGTDYIVLAIPYAGYLVCSVYSVFDPEMNAGRYLMLSPMNDFFLDGNMEYSYLAKSVEYVSLVGVRDGSHWISDV